MRYSLAVVFLFVIQLSIAQLPNTDIWLFQLKHKNDSVTEIKTATNITNRPGYDNQPSFSEDDKKIYFVTIKEDKQSDIYLYSIHTKKILQLTKTKESEYSPREITNTKLLSSVTVLQDSSQVIMPIEIENGLHSFYPISKNKTQDKQLQNIDSIGYYSFLNSDTVIFYKLTQPHSLRFFSIQNQIEIQLTTNPTRCFWPINRHILLYGAKDSSKVIFYKYNFIVKKASVYAEYNSLSEDFIWHSEWGLIKSEGTELIRFDEKTNSWKILFDLKKFGLKKITRFAISNNNKYLVVVDNL